MKLRCFLFIILFINIFSINTYAEANNTEEIIKVGVYESEPYYSVDSDGKVSGYYHDYLKLLQEKHNFKYEYVIYDFEDEFQDLEDGKIDIMLGISITPERIDKVIFSENFIAREEFALLTNKDITFDNLKNLKDIKIGLVKGVASEDMILDFFLANKIDIEPVYGENWKEIEGLLKEEKVDIILNNNYKKLGFKILYEIQGDQVYIAANKNRADILDKMDNAIEEIHAKKIDKINNLYNKYFNQDYQKLILIGIVLLVAVIISILLIIVFLVIPKIKENSIKNKIRIRMNDNKYLLQYQPIHNPRNKDIVGFEGLLRLKDKENKLIPPYQFIPEIEENDMLFEVSLWILKKAIEDYDRIKDYKCVNDKKFYISLNVSLNEIENDEFVKRAIQILSKSNLGTNQICLEIIERVKMHDLDKINKNINLLKNSGFKIAIDDFGVEYSNLDVLQKLDVDIIKIDKNFVDGIGKDIIRNEIVLFISKIAKDLNKSVVLEGVEDIDQDNAIKKIENDLLYVQGYYYNKPMHVEDIDKV